MKEDDDYKMELELNFLKHIGYEHINGLNEMLDHDVQDNKEIGYPKELDNWFEDFHIMEQVRHRKKQRKSVKVYLKKASVFLLFLVGINIVLITKVEAYRYALFDTFVSVKTEFTQIDFVNSETIDKADIPIEWVGKYYPTEIPLGYEFSYSDINAGTAVLVLTNEEGKIISFYQAMVQLRHLVNTEEGSVEKVMIGDIEGILLQNSYVKTLIWDNMGYYLFIESNDLTKEEMLHMAEHMKIKST